MLALRELLQGLTAQGRTIFYSSHVLEIVEKVCSRVLILRGGRVVADDSISRLRALLHQPSLEGIFTQLTEEQNHERLAQRILEVMQS
jgi:ABC-2 type transport system ATP-binding protein